MSEILKTYTQVIPEINLWPPPNLRWRSRIFHGAMVGLLTVFLWGGQTFALPDNKGTEFILGFIPNNHASLELHLASDVATEVTVQYPVNSPTFNKTVFVSPKAITTVVIPNAAQYWDWWPSDSVANNAVRAFAACEFAVYMVNKRDSSSDAALGLPVDVLDTDYIVMTYSPTHFDYSELLVVATEDNTVVTITGTPFDITLNTGEGYFVYKKSEDFTGTLIHADKPVSVTN